MKVAPEAERKEFEIGRCRNCPNPNDSKECALVALRASKRAQVASQLYSCADPMFWDYMFSRIYPLTK